MAKFFGVIGFGEEVENEEYINEVNITEREYYGDFIRNSYRNNPTENLNDSIVLTNRISIVADPYAYHNFHTMKYVKYDGTKWKVNEVEISEPRLIISFGGVYNDQP